MELLFVLKWVHILGACVLIGTGAGIAFFMVMAQRTGNVTVIAHTAKIVVVADWLFTASAVVVQPISGYFLALESGWNITEGWILLSLALYVVIGLFWVPVVWIQHQLARLACEADRAGQQLPAKYHRLYRIWFACGFPAFVSILAIVWLMVARPQSG